MKLYLVDGGRTTPPDAVFPPSGAFSRVASGYIANCALDAEKNVVCWGGDIGMRSFVDGPFKSVEIFDSHACAVQEDGHLVCWGADNYIGASGFSSAPTASLAANSVFVENLQSDYTFSAVTVGLFHSCGIHDGRTAGQTAGEVLCWGLNGNRQSEPPEQTFGTVNAGWFHTCGLLDSQNGQAEGTTVCWGAEDTDENGNTLPAVPSWADPIPNFGQAAVPAQLESVAMTSITAGRYHTCAIRTDDNTLECWGRMELAEIPDQLTSEHFISISASSFFTCGVTAAERVKCWGPTQLNRPESQTPETADSLNQFHVPDDFVDVEFVHVSAGYRHVCATKADGSALCWGGDADPSTPEIEIYVGSRIVNTRQAWVPPSMRARLGLFAAQTTSNARLASLKTQGVTLVPEFRPEFNLYSAEISAERNTIQVNAVPEINGVRTIIRLNGVVDEDGLLDLDGDGPFVIAVDTIALATSNRENHRYEVILTRPGGARLGFRQLISADPAVDSVINVPTATLDTSTSWIYDAFVYRQNTLTRVSECEGAGFGEGISPAADSGLALNINPSCPSGSYTVDVRIYETPSQASSTRNTSNQQVQNRPVLERTMLKIVDRLFGDPSPIVLAQGGLAKGRLIAHGITQFEIPDRSAYLPTANLRILRIEPTIRGVALNAGQTVRLDVAVYGRQDIRDDSLADRQNISFDWTSESPAGQTNTGNGHFEEAVSASDARDRNGAADDIEVLYTASDTPGRYVVTASLEPGVECLGIRDGETDEDAQERCSAEFEVTARRAHIVDPTPIPPRDPAGDLPNVLADDDGTNYEVFTPEGGGEFSTDKCSLKIPNGAVNDMEVIGVSITEIQNPEEQVKVVDPRYLADGIQCRIDAVSSDGDPLVGYQLLAPGNICQLLPDRFRPNAVDAIVGAVDAQGDVTALTSKLYLSSARGDLKVCGNIAFLPATTSVMLRAEAAVELPPAPAATPVLGDIDTGGRRVPEGHAALLILIGFSLATIGAAYVLRHRRRRNR